MRFAESSMQGSMQILCGPNSLTCHWLNLEV